MVGLVAHTPPVGGGGGICLRVRSELAAELATTQISDISPHTRGSHIRFRSAVPGPWLEDTPSFLMT